jgi:hypothetical protein
MVNNMPGKVSLQSHRALLANAEKEAKELKLQVEKKKQEGEINLLLYLDLLQESVVEFYPPRQKLFLPVFY